MHAVECYEEVKAVLHLIVYDTHEWVICMDLKTVNFLLSQHGGYTAFYATGIAGKEIDAGPRMTGESKKFYSRSAKHHQRCARQLRQDYFHTILYPAWHHESIRCGTR